MFDKQLTRILTVLFLLLSSVLFFFNSDLRLLPLLLLSGGIAGLWQWFLVTKQPDDEMTNKLISCCHYLGDEDK